MCLFLSHDLFIVSSSAVNASHLMTGTVKPSFPGNSSDQAGVEDTGNTVLSIQVPGKSQYTYHHHHNNNKNNLGVLCRFFGKTPHTYCYVIDMSKLVLLTSMIFIEYPGRKREGNPF